MTEDGVAKHTFEYDWQGNPVTYNGHVRKFSKCNSLLKTKGQHYSYDLNGNRTSDSTNSYAYDALDRLIEVKTPSGIYRYTYDALGRRSSKTHAGKTTYFLWQKEQEIGAISTEGAIEELQVLSPSNRAVAFELQGTLYVPIHDALGHVRTLLDSAGNCVSTYRYSAFGEEQLQGDVLSPWRYSGKRMDAETGFVYFWKRYYDPKTLCWLTPDPIGDGDGPNYYAYVHNNPMLYSDPDGRFAAFVLLFELVSITWGTTEVAVAAITIEAATKAVLAAAVVAVAVNQGANIAEDAANSDREKLLNGNDNGKPPYDGVVLGENPANCPQEGFKWRGGGKQGSKGGAYFNGDTDESLRPDFHTPGHKPHWDYVSIFATESGVVLVQQPVEDKSNEITAIPKILDQINIEGAIITSDAMGCQKNIAAKICDRGADYILALKGNQESLQDEVENYFNQAERILFEGIECDALGSREAGHGRIEQREIYVTEDIDWLPQKDQWKNLKSIIMIKSERLLPGKPPSIEKRYYISSLPAIALRIANAIRKHWKIENNLHRQLDVNFMEDGCVANTGNAAENLATFRRLALNSLGSGKGLLARRKKAGWDENYLTEIVRKFFIKNF